MTAKKRFSDVMTTCSIIASILVVFIHVYNVGVYNNVSNQTVFWIEEIISQTIARGAVPYFFMSSAFFLYSSKKDFFEVYKSRFKSIFLPYLLWNTTFMIAFAVLKALSLSNTGMDKITASNVLSGVFLHKYNYSYWFMKYLIIFILLYPIIRWIVSRGKVISAVVGCAIVVAYFVGKTTCPQLLSSLVYYYFGAVIGFYYRRQAENTVLMKKSRQIATLGVLSLLAVSLFIATNVLHFELSLLRDFVMVFCMFFAVVCFGVFIKGTLAGISFMIYSMHPIILEIVEKSIYNFLPHTVLWMMIDYFLAPIICLGIILVACITMKKICPKIYKVLNGGRL